MNKFILKYFLIFLFIISLMFYSLIFFQKYSMEKEMKNFEHMQMQESLMYGDTEMPMPMAPPPAPKKKPPMALPLLFILGVSSILIYSVLRYIDKNFVAPLDIIEKNTNRIKDGFLDVDFKTKSESPKIVETFNTMNNMVQGLKQREKLHDNFIRNLVHDLRAPVIAQEKAMEILSDELKENALVDGMVKNTDAFLKMINAVIESFSNQEIKIEKMDFDFSQLTEDVINALKPAAAAKNIELKTSIQNNLTVWADYVSFNRIIMNLISNAIENIDNNKIVTVKAKRNPKSTVIVIEDNGSGMNEETKEKIFTDHLKRNFSDKKSISGMGLSIVYDLVAKNGGQIRVETEKDKYTKFIIELSNEGENE